MHSPTNTRAQPRARSPRGWLVSLKALTPLVLAGSFFWLGAAAVLPRSAEREVGNTEGPITVDSFSDETVAVSLLKQRASAFRLEYLDDWGLYRRRQSLYEQNYQQWLQQSAAPDNQESRRAYQRRAGSPPEFDVDKWVRNYRQVIAALQLPEATWTLEVSLLSLLRRHERGAEFTATYLEILRRAPQHPAVARHSRFAVSRAIDPGEREELLASLRHVARFASDPHVVEELQAALNAETPGPPSQAVATR
jgi:hypothetical protein